MSFPSDYVPRTSVQSTYHKSSHEDKYVAEPFPTAVRALKDGAASHEHTRTLVICLDGTGDQFDNDNSNVVHFVSCLRKHDPSKQVTYYQSGIGTYDAGGLRNGMAAAIDMAVGSGLGIHIKDAYKFLMQNYRDGDKICLFGFSRGAYTVRCLAGMLHKVGLLPASNGAQVNFAYSFFKDDTVEGWKMSAQFKKTFCTNVNVHFVGVWDCVASVGFIPRKLPFSKSPTNSIHFFRHAMALDEHRAKFKLCQWQQQNPAVQRKDTIDNTPRGKLEREVRKYGIFSSIRKNKATEGVVSDGLAKRSNTAEIDHYDMEAEFEKLDGTRKAHQRAITDAKECYFMGAHADVGGGAVPNETRHMLSRIPLRWMIRQCFECDTGILFSTSALAEQGLDLSTLWPDYKPTERPRTGPSSTLLEKYEQGAIPPITRRSTALGLDDSTQHDRANIGSLDLLPEQMEDYLDSMAGINDQLVQAKGWWILELWPVKVRVQLKDQDGWEKKVRMNLGRYRAVREMSPNLHWTVQDRVEKDQYKLRCRHNSNAKWNVIA
ncbi:hypothetical protein EJ05DRAFT_515388 [Pseudovirgaria hyperparasitica]|uniref:T6SS Phospholipase effector Tle1-like catalytic domain-containing protein n=1 Tax=Pseudovirgaria hyperparasitica TaxID=470096 RepID=A0A6A6VQB0_9PEZI|nr:uncharacterized protein EJ05DRAFT_515388 [Pseudovirgaria hyperparasitica]KAF2752802.1 hypothetical protein EJ05DRAFT_515388 [Pseudovirgaria hyperparasitica]